MRTFNTYNSSGLILRGTIPSLDVIRAKYKVMTVHLVNGEAFLPFSEHDSAKYQQCASFVYYDMMGAGEHEPDAIELGRFVEEVWDLPHDYQDELMSCHLQRIATELDRAYGIDLWWTFVPELRFEI